MICPHKFSASAQEGYEVCDLCGTFHSTAALEPSVVYEDNYWSPKWEHNTIQEHQYNVDVHQENGLSKNAYVLSKIDTVFNSALEIACAPGNLLKSLSNVFNVVVGIEVDRKYEPDIREICGPKPVLLFGYFPMVTLKDPDASYDLIIGLDIFEHIHEPIPFLSECKRLLRTGGQVLIMSPLMNDEFNPRFFHTKEHVWIYTENHLRELVAKAGFSIEWIDKWTAGHEFFCLRHDNI